MGMTGAEAADYIYGTVIPKVQACANQTRSGQRGRARLVAQIDCVRQAFGK